MEEVVKDPRFSHIVKDARFRRLPRKHVKVKVDKRFQSMFTDKKFQIKCKVDKRGRPVNFGGSEDLKRYYDVSDSDESEEDSGKERDSTDEAGEEVEQEEINEEESRNETENNDQELEKSEKKDVITENSVIPEANKNLDKENLKKENKMVKKCSRPDKKLLTAEIKRKLRSSKIDYARGEGKFLSESSSEEEVSDSEVSDAEVHEWGELDNDAETTEEETNRLAICNMNWDRVKAVDLMVLFHSFLPPGGLIHSITIYPSDFGIQRMKEEEEQGPLELKELKADKEDADMDREQMEKLRKYQLNRLKYYYAIMVCDTKETANVLYKECDGLEYECSAVKLDLRFVPDDTTFEQEAKDVCTALPDLSTYKPRLFRTTALTCSKVELTWDENDRDREEIIKSVHSGNIDEDQLKEYLAYSSTDDDDDDNCEDAKILTNDNELKTETEQSSIDKYKALLEEIELNEKKKKKNQVNLEVTWNLTLENKANEMVKEKMKDLENLTPFEQFMEKKKEKKKKKKQEKLAKMEQTENSDDNAFSDDDVPSDIDLQDPYFKEELDQMKRKKKKAKKIEENPETEEDRQKKAELELLMLDNDSKDKHFSLKKIEEMEKKKKKRGKKRKIEPEPKPVDDFKIDVNDERFSALYTSHHFNIDPTDPHYKPTKATTELIQEKLRRRAADEVVDKSRKIDGTKKPRNSELNVLVKNIKKNAAGMNR